VTKRKIEREGEKIEEDIEQMEVKMRLNE
jgi:hypothetical protein